MKLAVISDIHGNLAALDAVLEDISHEGVDQTVNLGDVLSGPLDVVGVAERLMPLALPTVRGNHDRFIVDGREADKDWHIDQKARALLTEPQRQWLGGLPPTLDIEGKVLLTHGTPASDSIGWLDDAATMRPASFVEEQAAGHPYEVLLCGHTHVPRISRLADGRLVVNPGAVGLQFDLGYPDARYAVIERRTAGWHVALRSVPYDFESTARRAEEIGLKHWAEAYRAGWVLPKYL
jgi:predicted phosphodiesterase